MAGASPSRSVPIVQRCISGGCGGGFAGTEVLAACPACGELLDVVYDWEGLGRLGFGPPRDWAGFERCVPTGGLSGVWQFRRLLPFYLAGRGESEIVSVGEGRTLLQRAESLGRRLGFAEAPGLHLQYEGFNPSGSFKDNGMAAGFTHARMVGARTVVCASTGNTSASMAMYAAHAGLRAVVFIGEGKIAMGKLSQALDYGALTLQVAGDFDACLSRVRAIAADSGAGVYLLNSVNPFRIEGQKTIMFRVLRDLGWRVPDWIVVPGGNLGNCSAFAKAFIELRGLGLVDRLPRLAVINATGARTLDRVYNDLSVRWNPRPGDDLLGEYDRSRIEAELARMDAAGEKAHTIASAIEINRPVNLPKALRALWAMNGVVRAVGDEEILEHKALVGRHGYGCEPASAAAVAGAHMLLREGVIRPDELVVCILTGHPLKDPDATVGFHTGGAAGAGLANRPVRVADDDSAIRAAIEADGDRER